MGMHWLWFFWEVLLDRRGKKREATAQILCQISADCSTFGRTIERSQEAAPRKAEVSLFACFPNRFSDWRYQERTHGLIFLAQKLEPTGDETLRLLPTEGFVFSVVSSVFTESRDGDGAGTHVYQKRGELESRRTQKTFQCDTNHTHPWDRLQCTMGEGRIQQRRDEPESK